jgi:hypothetical protein
MLEALAGIAIGFLVFAVWHHVRIAPRMDRRTMFHVKHSGSEEAPQLLEDAIAIWQLRSLGKYHSRNHMRVNHKWSAYRWNRASELLNWANLRTEEVDYHTGVRMLRTAFKQQARNSTGSYVTPFPSDGGLYR